jgi:hypothetical protein
MQLAAPDPDAVFARGNLPTGAKSDTQERNANARDE